MNTSWQLQALVSWHDDGCHGATSGDRADPDTTPGVIRSQPDRQNLLFEAVWRLASDLYVKNSKERDAVLSNLEPKLRKAVDVTLRKVEGHAYIALNAIRQRSEDEPNEQ